MWTWLTSGNSQYLGGFGVFFEAIFEVLLGRFLDDYLDILVTFENCFNSGSFRIEISKSCFKAFLHLMFFEVGPLKPQRLQSWVVWYMQRLKLKWSYWVYQLPKKSYKLICSLFQKVPSCITHLSISKMRKEAMHVKFTLEVMVISKG